MNILNMLFTGLFTVEMILKLIAFKPRVGALSSREQQERTAEHVTISSITVVNYSLLILIHCVSIIVKLLLLLLLLFSEPFFISSDW